MLNREARSKTSNYGEDKKPSKKRSETLKPSHRELQALRTLAQVYSQSLLIEEAFDDDLE
jgi:hypothetical protein